MVVSTLDRVWQRLVNRYEPDDGSDCCGAGVEPVPARTREDDWEHCCE